MFRCCTTSEVGWPHLLPTELAGVKEIMQCKMYQETDTITPSSGEDEKTGGGGFEKGTKMSAVDQEIFMNLNEKVVKTFCVAKSFKDNDGGRVNSIHFSWNGLNLITSSEEDQIVIYDCERGDQKRLVNSQKYGVDLARFTHAHNAAIHASTKRDDAIRYLSLHDNKFIRYFTGHTKKVISLEMSPTDDTFISGGLDNSVRLWDLRTPSCNGLMQVTGKPVCAFDPEGLIFSVGVNSEQVCENISSN